MLAEAAEAADTPTHGLWVHLGGLRTGRGWAHGGGRGAVGPELTPWVPSSQERVCLWLRGIMSHHYRRQRMGPCVLFRLEEKLFPLRRYFLIMEVTISSSRQVCLGKKILTVTVHISWSVDVKPPSAKPCVCLLLLFIKITV